MKKAEPKNEKAIIRELNAIKRLLILQLVTSGISRANIKYVLKTGEFKGGPTR